MAVATQERLLAEAQSVQREHLPEIDIPEEAYPIFRTMMLKNITGDEPPVIQLMNRVVAQSLDVIGSSLDFNRVEAVNLSHENSGDLLNQAADLVDIAYSLRYNGRDGLVAELGRDFVPERDSAVIGAVYQGRKDVTLLGTIRTTLGAETDIISPETSPLELFRYFMNDGLWPHQIQEKNPSEIGRFGLNELISALSAHKPTRKYGQLLQQSVFRSLWTAAYDYAIENDQWVGYIAAPSVNSFLQSAGLYGVPQTQLSQNMSDDSQYTRTAFPRYWHPHEPKSQPLIYEAPPLLQSVMCKLPDGSEITL